MEKKFKTNYLGFKSLIHIFQGIAVGTGAILPGVSGGVLCVAFGIYEPMMALFSHPKNALKKYYKLFIPFIIGWALGFTLLAGAVKLLFETSSSVALMLFFGLVCGTLPELFKKADLSDTKMSWTPLVLGLSISYLMFNILEKSVTTVMEPSTLTYVFCGLVWGLSMIIPGLSSSSILIYLGLYEPMMAGIATFDFSVLLPLVIGLIITALVLARAVNKLFEKHYAFVSRIILGIVIASSLKIVPLEFENTLTLLVSVVCFAIGFTATRFMDKNNDPPA